MTSDLKEVIAHGTGNVDIKDIVNGVRNLLIYSNGAVEAAKNVEDEIGRRWPSVWGNLQMLLIKIERDRNIVENCKAKLDVTRQKIANEWWTVEWTQKIAIFEE